MIAMPVIIRVIIDKNESLRIYCKLELRLNTNSEIHRKCISYLPVSCEIISSVKRPPAYALACWIMQNSRLLVFLLLFNKWRYETSLSHQYDIVTTCSRMIFVAYFVGFLVAVCFVWWLAYLTFTHTQLELLTSALQKAYANWLYKYSQLLLVLQTQVKF